MNKQHAFAVGFLGGEELRSSHPLNLEGSAFAVAFVLSHDRRADLPYRVNTHCAEIWG
jgi:hypothetical protein